MGAVDVFTCVVMPVSVEGSLDGVWRPGPLPVAIPATDANRSGWSKVADTVARSGYFAPRIVDTLYSSDPVGSTGRWHLEPAEAGEFDGAELVGWECLIARDHRRGTVGYAVAHLQLWNDALSTLADLTRRAGAARQWLESLVPEGLHVDAGAKVGLVSHVAYAGAELPEPDDRERVLAATATWDVSDRWLWFAGTGVPADSYLPDPDAPRPGTTIFLSSDWRALALRTGVAYCALTNRATGPHDLLRAFSRTIHLDGFLLCQLQTDAAQHLADDISATRMEELTVEAAMELEEQMLALRGVLWWRHVTGYGSQVDQVIRALQDERDLPALYQQLVVELTDTGRFIQLRHTLAEQERERKISQLVSVVSAAFVTPSVFLAAVALVPDPSRTLQVAFWVCSGVLAVVTWFGIRAWFARSERPLGGRGPRHAR